MKKWHAVLSLTLMIIAGGAMAAYPHTLPAAASSQTRWVFSRANACLKADNITRVAANGECLVLQTYLPPVLVKPHPILVVFIHGDGIPGGGPSDYLKFQATAFSSGQVVPVVLIRPGYYDSYNHYSTGESYAFYNQGYPGDSYRPHTVATLAAAVAKLKAFYHPKATLLVGHSGGGIMSGIILGQYPGLADGAVLASVVGNVHRWGQKHGWGRYIHSLSPNDFVNTIPLKDRIYIVSGTNDKNTYPAMTPAY